MREHGGQGGGQSLSEPSRDGADRAAPTPGRQSVVQLRIAPVEATPVQVAPAEQSAPGPTPQLPHYSSIQRIFGNRVQAKAAAGSGAPDVHAAAAQGISGPAGQLPHLEQIQRSFGKHDVSHIQAHVGGAAAAGAQAMGAEAFATGDHVAFAGAPSLHIAATAAAPVQRNTLVVGAPLLAGGPPGWVAYAVLGIASVGIMGYAAYQAAQSRARSRDRADPRVDPRVIPRTTSPQHRGRIQVQGGGLELSFPWTRPVPMTKAEGLAGLASLKGMLSRGELAVRDEAFVDAADFIEETFHTCPPDLRRTFQNSAIRDRYGNERVDIEIHTGAAFA